MKPLEDPRKEKFVQNLIKGMSQRKAYRDAFQSKGKDETCDQKASRLLKEGNVKARYEELQGKVADKAAKKAEQAAEKATDIGAEIIAGWKKILRASPLDYLDFTENANGKIVTVPKANISELDGFAIQEIWTDSAGNIKLKLYSKADAMKALAELYEVRTDTDNHGVKVVLPEELEDYTE